MNTLRLSVGALVSAGALEFGDGYRTKRSEHGLPGYRIIRVADVFDNVVQLDGPDFVSEQHVRAIGSKVGHPGDILLTTKGTIGRVAVMPVTEEPVVYSPQLCYFRVIDQAVINPQFLRYWFNSQEFWDQASYRMNNTDMAAYINMADIRSLKITLPSITDQQAIAEVLGALDEKIAANTKLAASIPALLQSTFRSIVTHSEMKVPFGDLATVTKGVSYKSVDLEPSPTALVTLKSFVRTGGYSSRGLKEYSGPHKPTQVVSSGELVVAQTDLTQAAEVVGRAVRVPNSSPHSSLVASLDVAIVRPVQDIPTEYLLGIMLAGPFREHCKANTSGTTVLHLRRNAIESFQAPLAPPIMQHQYATVARPILDTIDSLEVESTRLAALRDTLLPQLVSGRLLVKEAEAAVASTV